MNSPASLPSAAQPRTLHIMEVVGDTDPDGPSRVIDRMISYLSQQSEDGLTPAFRFTVLCPFEGDLAARVRAAGGDALVVPMPDDPPWSAIQQAVGLVRSRQPDVLHAHLPNAHRLAGLTSRVTGVPVLATLHGGQIGMADLEAHRMVGSHLSVVCQQSHHHALGLGIDARFLSCEPEGVDTLRFSPGPRSEEGLRQQLGIAPDALLTAFVGRLSAEESPDVFLRAASRLREDLPDAHFLIAGEGPMAAQLQESIEQKGLGGTVHLTGRPEDGPAFYREIDVLVCGAAADASAEALPWALMEGMACGVPALAPCVGGLAEVIEQGRSGWLVTPKDTDELTERLQQMLTQPEVRTAMAQRARESIEERHRLDRSLDALALRLRTLARPLVGEAPAVMQALAPVEARRPVPQRAAPASRGHAQAQALAQPLTQGPTGPRGGAAAAIVIDAPAAFVPASTSLPRSPSGR